MMAEEIVNRYAANFNSGAKITLETRSRQSSRMIWLVAVSGFVLTSEVDVWSVMSGSELSGAQLFLLMAPWAFAALLALVTIFLIDTLSEKDSYYVFVKNVKISTVLLGLCGEQVNDEIASLQHLIEDEDDEIQTAKSAVNTWARPKRICYLVTVALYVIAFLSALSGPFLVTSIFD